MTAKAGTEVPTTEPAAQDAKASGVKRLSVSLRPSDLRRVEELAAESGLPINEVIRRALATESFVYRNRHDGRRILVEDRDGKLREIEFLY
jgi:hypothetical protein